MAPIISLGIPPAEDVVMFAVVDVFAIVDVFAVVDVFVVVPSVALRRLVGEVVVTVGLDGIE